MFLKKKRNYHETIYDGAMDIEETFEKKSSSGESKRKLMRSTWLGLAFTRFGYLAVFQETNKCKSCFVTISNNARQ